MTSEVMRHRNTLYGNGGPEPGLVSSMQRLGEDVGEIKEQQNSIRKDIKAITDAEQERALLRKGEARAWAKLRTFIYIAISLLGVGGVGFGRYIVNVLEAFNK